MKKIILSLTLLAASSTMMAQDMNHSFGLDRYAQANKELPAPKKGEHRVVFMGNSITDGWPGQRPEFFKDNNFVGRGISGQTSYQFLLRFRNDVIDLKPEVVVINYGTNDIAENTGAYDEAQTFQNVKTMCDIARAHKIKVILASTLPHKGFGWRPSVQNAMAKVRSLNELVKAYAKENKIPYVDYFSAMVSEDGTQMRPELSGDGVHPNKDGYKIMEDLVLPVIKKLTK